MTWPICGRTLCIHVSSLQSHVGASPPAIVHCLSQQTLACNAIPAVQIAANKLQDAEGLL